MCGFVDEFMPVIGAGVGSDFGGAIEEAHAGEGGLYESMAGEAILRVATWDGEGENLALFSERATKVELCLFEAPDGNKETARIAAPEQTGQVWHVYLPEARPGQLYGYRVYGSYEPAFQRRGSSDR